jgi:thiol-disulfide isomerase/thioredoxin
MASRAPYEAIAIDSERRQQLSRRLFAAGIAGAATAATLPRASPQELDAPRFESGRFQFTLLSPVRDVPGVGLSNLDGTTADLASLRGKPLLINFWATWCAACRTELPILDRLQAEYRHTGLRILAVSEDRIGDRAAITRFIQILKIKALSVFWDPNGNVAFSDTENKRNAPFGLYGMPITYLVGSSGRVIGYMPGAADWETDAGRNLIAYLHRS